jgi:SAM-dependent methyltransferase
MSSVPTATIDPDVEKWSKFIESFYQKSKGEVASPFKPVDTLIKNYLPKGASVLDVGTELGKNAIPLIEAGHKVTLIDVAPNAITYTLDNIGKRQLSSGVVASEAVKIESLDEKYGPFKAIVGTYAFTFIPPQLFEEVMKNNVLGRIEADGYFVGGFFGKDHAWAEDPKLTILSKEQIEKFFSTMGFAICELEERSEMQGTVLFHTFEVIAKRVDKVSSK